MFATKRFPESVPLTIVPTTVTSAGTAPADITVYLLREQVCDICMRNLYVYIVYNYTERVRFYLAPASGRLCYRVGGNGIDHRLRLLWILSLPGASQSAHVSTSVTSCSASNSIHTEQQMVVAPGCRVRVLVGRRGIHTNRVFRHKTAISIHQPCGTDAQSILSNMSGRMCKVSVAAA